MNRYLDYDEAGNRNRVRALRQSGVSIWSAERVFIGSEVSLDAIEPGAVLMNAVIRGANTCIGAGSEIGGQGLATITDCQIGRHVELGPGSYRGCALLDHVKVRGFAEIRSGTVLEEQAELGHTVGLKNSFFGAAVVAGSLINFCDVFVSGGTSRSQHTEIGSGAVHFNFSPRRDKFASCLGDSTGLLGRSDPIFIGGNTGLVAPLTIPFGAVVPAGTTVREWPGSAGAAQMHPFLRKSLCAVHTIAALAATQAWYTQVRLPFADPHEQRLCRGALIQLGAHRDWRAEELNRYIVRMLSSETIQSALQRFGQEIRDITVSAPNHPALPPLFAAQYANLRRSHPHADALQHLDAGAVDQAQAWLRAISAQYVHPAETSAARAIPGLSRR